MASKTDANPVAPIVKRAFGVTFAGQTVEEYTLTSPRGSSVSLMTYGATLTSIRVPDRAGTVGEVTLGFGTLAQYEFESPYFGSTIGRVGNRVARGEFTMDGKVYRIPRNNGNNHLHGGLIGWDKRIWTAEASMSGGPSIRFSLVDPDGTEGYPGTVKASVIYTWQDDVLKIQYYATTDAPTPINLTNHAYFNLKDAGASPVTDHQLKLFADWLTPVDEELIPTGEIVKVAGTPMDFTAGKAIGKDLQAAGGFDHNFVLREKGGLMRAAMVYEPATGRVMKVRTTEPGVQFYSGNFLDGSSKNRAGVSMQKHAGFCLETQHYPDSINQPGFPSTLLIPGQVYRQVTEYAFAVSDKAPF